MKKLNMMTLLLGAALFTGVGVTSASAEMKCGAGKCGGKAMNGKMGNMDFSEKKKRCASKLHAITTCVNNASNSQEMNACRDQVVALGKKIEKMHGKSSAKCGAEKKAPAMKCGPGKCGTK